MTTNLTATVNRPYLPERGGGISCELVVEPDAEDEPAERHVALCIDSSGSMAYRKMDQVRDATNLVFGLLNDDDYLSIITFDTEVDVVMPATRWGDIEREEAEEFLEDIETRGGTDIYAGLEQARDTLSELDDGDRVSKRVLLLSDGRDLHCKAPDFKPLAKEIAEEGISVYSAGIGTNYGKDIIRTLGETSQGRWAHVDQATDIRAFFGDVIEEASTVIANNPQLVIDPVPGCEIGEAFRRVPQAQEVDIEYEDDSVIIGLPDLQDYEEQRVVLKMDAPGQDLAENVAIADVGLEAGSRSTSTQIEVTYTDDEEKLAEQNPDVFLSHKTTGIATRIAHADSEDELDDVKAMIEETEVIAGETQVIDTLRDDVTRIEQGDEEEVRQVQEKTTVVFDDSRFE